MASVRVGLHPEAVAEAQIAREWYEARSPAAGHLFLAELDRAIESIAEAPRRWAKYRFGTRRYLMRRFPFGVIYRISERDVEILAIAHGRRRPGYWRERVG
jgi:toxin ParE1/3/4